MSVTEQGALKVLTPLETILATYAAEPMLQRLASQSVLVPPEGPAGSPVMLVGEAPGEREAAEKRPFAGRAGAVLDRALKRAQIERKWSWVTNVVLYRPPANRTPYPFEIAASRPRLTAEIAICKPVIVVAMGLTAWRALLPGTSTVPFAEARGKWFVLSTGGQAHAMLCTWHPAATFHSDEADREFFEHIASVTSRTDG